MAKTPSFITELRLKVNCDQERRLLVRESREYQAARKLPKGEPKSEAWEARRSAFGAGRQRFQFSEYALHDDAKQFGHSWLGDHLDSHVVQKVATRAFKAVLRVGVGRAGRPRPPSQGCECCSSKNPPLLGVGSVQEFQQTKTG